MQSSPQWRRRRSANRGWWWLLALVLLSGGALVIFRGGLSGGPATTPAVAPVSSLTTTAVDTPSGPLTVYCGRSEALMAPLFDRFGAQSGASLVVRYGETWPLEEQLVREGTRTPAAVFVAQDAAALGALSRKGLLVELPADIVQRVEPQWAGTEAKRDWIGLSARARAVLYDPATTPAESLPRTLEELAEPRYEGRFGLAPGSDSLQAQLALYRVLKSSKALAELLAGIKRNHPKLYADNGQVVQAVARGEIAFGLVNHDSLWREAPEQRPGRLVATPMRGEGAGGFVNAAGVGVLARDPRALDLVRFLLSAEAQRRFAEQTFEYPLAKDARAREELPPLASLRTPTFDFADVAAVFPEAELALRKAGLVR